jgi:hypothetical protein
MTAATVRNLVLTTSSGFSADQLARFFATFEKTRRPTTEMVVFLNRSRLILFGKGRPLTDTTAQFLRRHSHELVDFKSVSLRMRRPACLLWPLWKRIFPRLKSESARRRLTSKVVSLFFLRFVLYLEYLESLPQKPGWVFLTDCRDVIFQDDIFSRVTEPGLYCFMEGVGKTIASSPANMAMVRNCFGDEAVKEIGACEISCAGTVLGDYASVCAYLQTMAAYARRVRRMQMISGDDQGLHNYLVHRRLVPGVRLIENPAGPVGTLGQMTMDEIKQSPERFVLQKDGRPYAVLHQYDRHPALVASHPFCRP